jgi:hypothetical protein
MTWDHLHDCALLAGGVFVVTWFETGIRRNVPLINRLTISMAFTACTIAIYLLGAAYLPKSNETAEQTPPVVPKPVRTITITVGRCPEGYQMVTRHDDGQTACAKDFVPTTK